MSTPADPITLFGVGVASAVTLGWFGLPIQPIVWGLIGGMLGMSLAKKAGFLMTCAIYVCSSLLSAGAGHLTAQSMSWSPGAGNIMAAMIGSCFHPLFALLVLKLPDLFAWALSFLPIPKKP